MEPAVGVTLFWVLFGATHIGLATPPLRTWLVARLGEHGFTNLFYAVAAAAFALLVRYAAVHRFEGAPGLGLAIAPPVRAILIATIVVGVVLLVAGVLVFPMSPMTRRRTGALEPRGLERVTRHAFFVGVGLLGLAHTLLATRLGGTLFFAWLTLFVAVGAWHQDRKLVRLLGEPYRDYLRVTSALPFAAILAGRQRFVWRDLPGGALAAGIVAAYGLRAVHESILARDGLWVIAVTIGGALVFLVQDRRRERRRATRLARA
jgi:uncharacterized membrane protein